MVAIKAEGHEKRYVLVAKPIQRTCRTFFDSGLRFLRKKVLQVRPVLSNA